jgi:ArsR family transcriptional regulator, lead/cadmium/zinc/bismuth-responsive transcriptional repressor
MAATSSDEDQRQRVYIRRPVRIPGATNLAEEQAHQHPVDPERVAAARSGQLPGEQARQLGTLLGVLGDPVRMRILTALLAARELCVGDLAMALGVNEDAVSYGRRVLRRHGLVQRRAAGRMGFYRLTDGNTQPALVEALRQL